jgi:hypothetical protein
MCVCVYVCSKYVYHYLCFDGTDMVRLRQEPPLRAKNLADASPASPVDEEGEADDQDSNIPFGQPERQASSTTEEPEDDPPSVGTQDTTQQEEPDHDPTQPNGTEVPRDKRTRPAVVYTDLKNANRVITCSSWNNLEVNLALWEHVIQEPSKFFSIAQSKITGAGDGLYFRHTDIVRRGTLLCIYGGRIICGWREKNTTIAPEDRQYLRRVPNDTKLLKMLRHALDEVGVLYHKKDPFWICSQDTVRNKQNVVYQDLLEVVDTAGYMNASAEFNTLHHILADWSLVDFTANTGVELTTTYGTTLNAQFGLLETDVANTASNLDCDSLHDAVSTIWDTSDILDGTYKDQLDACAKVTASDPWPNFLAHIEWTDAMDATFDRSKFLNLLNPPNRTSTAKSTWCRKVVEGSMHGPCEVVSTFEDTYNDTNEDHKDGTPEEMEVWRNWQVDQVIARVEGERVGDYTHPVHPLFRVATR